MNIESYIFLFIILGFHFVFDFIFQTNEMAQNKSKCIGALSQHVFVYTVGLILCSLYLHMFGYFAVLKVALHWALLNGIFHWITDFITSKVNSYFYKRATFTTFLLELGLINSFMRSLFREHICFVFSFL